MLLIPAIVLPCFLIGWLFYKAIRRAYRIKSPVRPLLLYPLICSAITTGGFMLWGYYVTFTSKSSTAAIGFFFVPFYSPVVAAAGFMVSWAILYVAWFILQRIQRTPVRLLSVALFVLAIAFLVWAGHVAQVKIARHRLMNEAASGYNVDRLETILAEGVSSQDFEVLANLAKNPNTPENDLVHLYDFCKPRISRLGGSESSILLPLARNPRTPPDILAVLASCRQSWIRNSVVRNPNTPISTLRQLTEDQDKLVKRQAKRELRLREEERKPDTE